MKVVTVCGSMQRRSANRAFAELVARLAPPGIEVAPSLRLADLPHYDADLDIDPAPPAVARWREQLRDSDAVLFVSPEYGHGMPGVMKNALDWLVGSGELNDKPVAATCAAQGKGRGLLGLASLVQTLRAIDAIVLASHPVVVARTSLDASGAIVDAAVHAEARALLERLARG